MLENKNPLLTVLICCYNAGRFLSECLDSLAAQKAPRSLYKILFINDGSTDGSYRVARSYLGHLTNCSFINSKQNFGLVACCNRGLDIIDTPFVMRLDADDYLSCDALEKVIGELEASLEADLIVFKRWDLFGGKILSARVTSDIYTWIASGTAFRIEAARSVGGYSKEYWEEYDFYLKLLVAGARYRVSPHRIYFYRRGQASMTGDVKQNKLGLDSLTAKWGKRALNRFGNPGKVRAYYRIV